VKMLNWVIAFELAEANTRRDLGSSASF